METSGEALERRLTVGRLLLFPGRNGLRWARNNNFTTEKTIPDLLDYVHVDGLKSVRLEALNIIR